MPKPTPIFKGKNSQGKKLCAAKNGNDRGQEWKTGDAAGCEIGRDHKNEDYQAKKCEDKTHPTGEMQWEGTKTS